MRVMCSKFEYISLKNKRICILSNVCKNILLYLFLFQTFFLELTSNLFIAEVLNIISIKHVIET